MHFSAFEDSFAVIIFFSKATKYYFRTAQNNFRTAHFVYNCTLKKTLSEMTKLWHVSNTNRQHATESRRIWWVHKRAPFEKTWRWHGRSFRRLGCHLDTGDSFDASRTFNHGLYSCRTDLDETVASLQ